MTGQRGCRARNRARPDFRRQFHPGYHRGFHPGCRTHLRLDCRKPLPPSDYLVGGNFFPPRRRNWFQPDSCGRNRLRQDLPGRNRVLRFESGCRQTAAATLPFLRNLRL